jgi:hypothetical protein
MPFQSQPAREAPRMTSAAAGRPPTMAVFGAGRGALPPFAEFTDRLLTAAGEARSREEAASIAARELAAFAKLTLRPWLKARGYRAIAAVEALLPRRPEDILEYLPPGAGRVSAALAGIMQQIEAELAEMIAE